MSSESSLVGELRKLAKAKDDASTFDLRHDNIVVRVEYSGGSSSSLTFSCLYDAYASARRREGAGPYRNGGPFSAIGPMHISLRPERPNDGATKESGLDVEFQPGDKLFDDAGYIDAPSPEDDVGTYFGASLGCASRFSRKLRSRLQDGFWPFICCSIGELRNAKRDCASRQGRREY